MKGLDYLFFLAFPILIYSASKYTASKILCIGKNSFINEDKKCECKSEFPFGDPNSTEGCFNCEPMCDSNSICYKSNKCKCFSGYYKFGARNESCRLPFPELLSSNTITGSTSGGTEVILEIKSPPKYEVHKAFCRFGPIYVRAKFSNNTVLVCMSPFNRKGKMPLAVSYDSIHWSEKQLTFTYYNEGYSIYNCVLLSILILVISMIISVIFWFLNSKKEFLYQSEEMLPLNQWHMGQGLGSVTEEKGFLDFIKNIVIN